MFDVIRTELLPQGHMEKSHRWIGFVQGVLWAFRLYTILQLKQHNITGEEFDEQKPVE